MADLPEIHTPEKQYFYVIGGEYEDTQHERLKTETAKIQGPFTDEKEAMAAWRKLSEKTSGDPTIAYEIVRVFHKLSPAAMFGLNRAA